MRTVLGVLASVLLAACLAPQACYSSALTINERQISQADVNEQGFPRPDEVDELGPRIGRTVLQAGTTPVTTPAELQNAVASGARHIVVQQHMDLSSLQPAMQDVVLGVALNTTFSVTGSCATAPGPQLSQPGGAELRPLLPGQCLLLTDTSLLSVTNSSLWLDNLYIRLKRTAQTPVEPRLLSTDSESPGVYLSGVTLQGDGQFKTTGSTTVQSCGGLLASSPVYMQGCTLSHLGGELNTLGLEDSANIINTTIVDNAQFDDGDAVLYMIYSGSTAWLRGVTFARNNAPLLIYSFSGGDVYSDEPREYYSRLDDQYVATLGAPGAGADFLSPQDAFFQTATAGVARAPAVVPAQAAVAEDAVTAVATPQELQRAVQQGARHIEVTAHMDLTTLDAAANPGDVLLGYFSDTTRSIKGNCKAAPQLQLQPPLLKLRPGQCVLVTDMDLWHVRYGQLWMHNLYLRHTATVRDDAVALVTSTEITGRLWMTYMTLQGAGQYAAGAGALGLTAGGPTYVEGCEFRQLGGSEQPIYANAARVRIVNSTLVDNTVTDADSGLIYTYFSDATVWLQGVALVNNSAALPLVAGYSSDGFASDVPREFYETTDKTFSKTAARPAEANAFLSGEEAWFQAVRAVFPDITITSTAAVEPPTTRITAVASAEELQAAVAAGARHIELQAHVDLSSLQPTDDGFLLGGVSSSTRTLRGNCVGAPNGDEFQVPGKPLLPLAEGQCLIVADDDVLEVMHGRVWVDNLYMRVRRSSRNSEPVLLSVAALGGQLWLTRSTLQGDGTIESLQGTVGLYATTTNQVFAQGVHFADLGGSDSPVYIQSQARFVDCTFTGNSVAGVSDGIILAYGTSTEVWLQACQLDNNTATLPLVGQSSATFYSDGPEQFYSAIDSTEVQPQATPPDTSAFLSLEDTFVKEASQEAGQQLTLAPAAPAAPGAAPAAPTLTVADAPPTASAGAGEEGAPGADTTAGDDSAEQQAGPQAAAAANANNENNNNNNVTVNVPSSDSDTNWPAIGGGIGAVVIIILLAICVTCLFVTRRRNRDRTSYVAQSRPGHQAGHSFGSGPPGPSKRGHSDFSVPNALYDATGPGAPGTPKQGQTGSTAAAFSAAPGPQASMHHEGPGPALHQLPGAPGASMRGPTGSMHGTGSEAGGAMLVNPMASFRDSAGTTPSVPPGALFQGAANGASSQSAYAFGSQTPTGLTTTAPSDVSSAGVRSNITTSVGTATSVYNTSVSAGETTLAQQKDRLTTELDHMRHHNEQFLGQFVVLPWTERREGGQGVVQFMRSARTEEAVAVKFFLSRSAFDAELELYKVEVLRSMMPAVRLELSNADAAERNSRGYPWPPCIVIEKGESLQEWKAKTQPAFTTIVDALCLIAERLAQLHGSGWVHRDLKPGNVLRLPGQHSWTLMDFGCAARTRASVPITFSPSYAPPEVAVALERGDRNITADAAADMWALGLMAFELLTSEPVFPPLVSTRDSISAQLCGREALPWEDGAPKQATKLAQLRGLKRAVLQCLQRQPEERPTAEQVLLQWRTLFDSRTAAGPPMI